MAKGLKEGRLKSYIIMMTRILLPGAQGFKERRTGRMSPKKDKDSEWRDREIKCAHDTC